MNKTVDDYINTKGNWSQRLKLEGKSIWTVSGCAWNNIKLRTSNKKYYLDSYPTYTGCRNEFKDFNSFTEWHKTQVGYGRGYCLDADILRNGDKVYSESTCLLIPNGLNIFVQGHEGKSKVGNYPQGVYLTNNKEALRVQIYTKDSGYRFIGTFKLYQLEQACAAYANAKNEAAMSWYESLLRGDYEVDYRVVEYMKNWRHQA